MTGPTDRAGTEPILAARGVSKRFPGVVALDRVDFDVQAGEVHAVLGQNGAGKTTLMNILFGLVQPDAGALYLRGVRVHFRSPHDAIARGIGMVHQTRRLVPAHTVLENIVLGHPRIRGVLNLRAARRVAEVDAVQGHRPGEAGADAGGRGKGFGPRAISRSWHGYGHAPPRPVRGDATCARRPRPDGKAPPPASVQAGGGASYV